MRYWITLSATASILRLVRFVISDRPKRKYAGIPNIGRNKTRKIQDILNEVRMSLFDIYSASATAHTSSAIFAAELDRFAL